MKNMRKGFTMIELVFVIVIIGILAAVAIPKLAATRDDAKKTSIMANLKLCAESILASYLATGTVVTLSTSCQKGDFENNAFQFRRPSGETYMRVFSQDKYGLDLDEIQVTITGTKVNF